jgi:hypothetical protein
MSQIFTEFTGVKPKYAQDDAYYGTGDVKYHLGTSYDRPTAIPGQFSKQSDLHGCYCLLAWHLPLHIPVPMEVLLPAIRVCQRKPRLVCHPRMKFSRAARCEAGPLLSRRQARAPVAAGKSEPFGGGRPHRAGQGDTSSADAHACPKWQRLASQMPPARPEVWSHQARMTSFSAHCESYTVYAMSLSQTNTPLCPGLVLMSLNAGSTLCSTLTRDPVIS